LTCTHSAYYRPVTVTQVTVTSPPKPFKLTRLDRRRKRLGITHDAIAARARVDRTLVVHVFAARRKSQNVITATEALCVEALARKKNGDAETPVT
jgi:hypothetical protein